MTEPIHGGHLVPVRRDPITGERSVLCFLDQAMWAFAPDGWAMWCPTCRSLVSEVLPGTDLIPDLDGAPASVSDPYFQAESRISEEHAAEMASQPAEWEDLLTREAWRVW